MLLLDAQTLWLRHLVARSCAPAYIRACRRTLSRFRAHTPAVFTADLTPALISDYLASLDALAKTTRATVRGQLLAWVNWLALEEVAPAVNWGARVAQVRAPHQLVDALTPEQARKFLLTLDTLPRLSVLAERRASPRTRAAAAAMPTAAETK